MYTYVYDVPCGPAAVPVPVHVRGSAHVDNYAHQYVHVNVRSVNVYVCIYARRICTCMSYVNADVNAYVHVPVHVRVHV